MSKVRVIDVVAAIIEHEGKILACRRRPEKAAGGKWEFPGGKQEPGETPDQALVREIFEELEVAIRVEGPLRTDDTTVGGDVIRLTCMRARFIDAPPERSSDHDDLRWLAPEELSSLDWAAPDLPAVAELAGLAISE